MKEFFIDEFDEDSQSEEESEDTTNTTTDLVKSAGGNQLVSYQNNTFIDKFEQREYKGLVPQVEANASTEIQMGQFGTSRSYNTM